MKSLELRLRDVRATGRKALVPYFMAGATPDWVRHVEAAVHAGADAVEIGIPFSDPMMDGVVIQEAAIRALAGGTTLDSIGRDLSSMAPSVPLIAMTYFNIIHHYGLERAAGKFESIHVQGAIVPDLALEESDAWSSACEDHDVATIFLVAPSSGVARVKRLAQRTEGFAYASARMAVTGQAADIGEAQRVVDAIRECSDVPTYVGIGITTPQQAHDVAAVSDGVIVGSALVKIILDGGGTAAVESFVASFRRAID